MEVLLFALTLVVLAVVAVLVHRHLQTVAWDRELDQAFGVTPDREIPRHRTL
jgi:hypothetical protein